MRKIPSVSEDTREKVPGKKVTRKKSFPLQIYNIKVLIINYNKLTRSKLLGIKNRVDQITDYQGYQDY